MFWRRILLFFFLLFFFFTLVKIAQGEVFVKREKCALCHIYDSIFFDKSIIDDDTINTKRGKDFCLSCHNGSVVDSREKLLLGFQHPEVAMQRRGKDGERIVKKGCSACHTPHTRIGWRGYAGTDISLYTGGDHVCISCHRKFEFSGEKGNHTYEKKGGCLTCHTLHGASTRSLLKNNYSGTCRGCHSSIVKLGEERKGHVVGKVKKKPVMFTGRNSLESREEVDLDCNVCHAVHEAKVKRGLLQRSPKDLCNNCHRGSLGAAEGQKNNGNHPSSVPCTDCHLVHYIDLDRTGKGIGVVHIEPATLCSNCHADKADSKENRWNHITGKAGGIDKICLRCHSMHKGILGSPNLISEGDVVCIECHKEENPLNESTARPMAHPLFEVVSDRDTAERLESFGGKTGKFGEIICRSCHTVHGAQKEKLLLADNEDMCLNCHVENEIEHGRNKYACTECHYVHGIKAAGRADRDGDVIKLVCLRCHELKSGHRVDISRANVTNRGALPLFDIGGKRSMRGTVSCPTCHDPHGKSGYDSFLRKPYKGTTFLCVSCHPDKENVSLIPHDLRSLASESLCEPCHSPHNGEEELMWGFVTEEDDYSVKYCGSCHYAGGMASAIQYGQGHPVNVIPQNKEGIPFNYYDSNWTENELGMIACPTCHDVHGEGLSLSSDAREGLLRLTYTFGEQSGHIERESFCLSCHVDKKGMIRGFHGDIACESCHSPHQDLQYPDGAREISWLCLRCHSDVPPEDAAVFKQVGKEMGDRYISGSAYGLYDAQGRNSPQGRISCPSCHEVHSGKMQLELSFKETTEDGTCYRCHPEKKKFKRSPHDLSKGKGRGCKKCHGLCTDDIPEIEVARLVEEFNANPADGNCLYCHAQSEGRALNLFHPKNIKEVSSSYGAQVHLESPIKMVSKIRGEGPPDFPLFSDTGVAGNSGTLGCLTCHDPHRGNRIDSVKIRFLRDETGYFIAAICTPCHRSDAEKRVREFHSLRRKEE